MTQLCVCLCTVLTVTCITLDTVTTGLLLRGFSSAQSLDRLGRQGDMTDDSAEILFQSFLQEALVSSSSMSRDVHSLMLSIQHFHCRPWRRPPSKVP